MKILLIALTVLVAGCGSENSTQGETPEQIAQRRFKAPGVCGDAAVAMALSAHKWCAMDPATEGVQTIKFDASNCSVVQTTTVVEMDQAGATRNKKKTISGQWYIDQSTYRSLHVLLKDYPKMFHSMEIAGEGYELKLTDEQFVSCEKPSEPQEAPPTDEPVQPGNELGTEI